LAAKKRKRLKNGRKPELSFLRLLRLFAAIPPSEFNPARRPESPWKLAPFQDRRQHLSRKARWFRHCVARRKWNPKKSQKSANHFLRRPYPRITHATPFALS
jgi:hypothetical protein